MIRFPAQVLMATLLISVAWPQEDAPAPVATVGNVVKNSDFEKTYDKANLWNGVDHDGFLAGQSVEVKAIDDWGNIAPQAMPVAVSVGDLNGDGLPDIISTDPLGYVRVYFNEGSKTEPKFGGGELSLPFLARPDGEPRWIPNFGERQAQKAFTSYGTDYNQWLYQWSRRRQAPRAYLAPGGRGLLDLWVGNYFGEVLFVRNEGNANVPSFNQPRDIQSLIIPTAKDPNVRWGNLFAPAYADITGNGVPDLLIAEGSYSANNVHLLVNEGAIDRPTFRTDRGRPVALGEGRQQLTVAVTDVNGDNRPDLLVSDRAGRVAVHLRPDNWSPGKEIPFSGYLAAGGGLAVEFDKSLQIGVGITALATGDLNGDGLFDLVVGRSNGRIAWSANRGSASEPKFEGPEEIRAAISAPPVLRQPEQWLLDDGSSRGNFRGIAGVVSAGEDSGVGDRGGNVVKFGYQPSINKIIKTPDPVFPGAPKFDPLNDDTGQDNLFRLGTNYDDYMVDGATRRMREAPSNAYLLRQKVKPMKIGATYVLSFDVRGTRATNGRVHLGWRGFKRLAEDRLVRGARGAVERQREVLSDTALESFSFNIGSNWTQITKELRIVFPKTAALNKEPATSEAFLEIYCELAPPEGAAYIANVKLEPKE